MTRYQPADGADLTELEAEVIDRIAGFIASIAANGVHVGIAVGDEPVTCATCGEPWPCRGGDLRPIVDVPLPPAPDE